MLTRPVRYLPLRLVLVEQVVRNFWGALQELLASGDISAVFGNEDEAREYLIGFNASGTGCALLSTAGRCEASL